MKSIYSIQVLQRILDHWGIGQIEDVTYFDNAGQNIWRHHLETNHGEFELYSYPASQQEYAWPRLQRFLRERLNSPSSSLDQQKKVHSFDRYHVLRQLTTKHQINAKQAKQDLDLLTGATIEKAFRVYGSIFQLHLNNADVTQASVLVSYGRWNIQKHQDRQANIIVDSEVHSYDHLDKAIEEVSENKPVINKYMMEDDWFELYLSNGISLHFIRSYKFPAIEVHPNSRRHELLIYEENELYYTKSYQG